MERIAVFCDDTWNSPGMGSPPTETGELTEPGTRRWDSLVSRRCRYKEKGCRPAPHFFAVLHCRQSSRSTNRAE